MTIAKIAREFSFYVRYLALLAAACIIAGAYVEGRVNAWCDAPAVSQCQSIHMDWTSND